MSVCSDRNAAFKFALISCNEVKLPNLFVLALGPYPVDQQRVKRIAYFYSTNLRTHTVHTVCLDLYNKIYSTVPNLCK
jgi:hypothetical protein